VEAATAVGTRRRSSFPDVVVDSSTVAGEFEHSGGRFERGDGRFERDGGGSERSGGRGARCGGWSVADLRGRGPSLEDPGCPPPPLSLSHLPPLISFHGWWWW
jgi:hypothetical protein